MTEAPEPEDKLDATMNVAVNGPEDAPFDWHAIDWRRVEDDIRRLRQRIFTASPGGGPEEGPLSAEVDVALAREHAGERAARDRAQRRSSDGGRGRRGGAHPRGQSKTGRKDRAPDRAVQGLAGQARVHPEEGQRHQAPTTRNSRDRRPLPSGTGRQRVG